MSTQEQSFDPKDIKIIDVAQLSVCEKRMTLEVTGAQVTQYLSACGGFRPSADLNRLKEQLVQLCIETALAENPVKPLWDIVPSSDIANAVLERDKPFSFSVDIDVHPAIEWPDFSALKIIRPVRAVSDEMIDFEINEQCSALGTTEAREGDFEGGDSLQVEITIHEVDTNVVLLGFTSDIKVPSVSGSLMLVNLRFEGLYEGLQGSAVGDQVELFTTVPQGFADPTLEGKRVRATLSIKGATRPIPATVEKVLSQYGTPNEIILRQQIKYALEAATNRDQMAIVTQQLLGGLLELVADQLQVPERVQKAFKRNAEEQARQSLEARGFSGAELEKEFAGCTEQILMRSTLEMRQHALVSLLAQHFSIRVNEQDIMGWFAEQAAKQGRRPEDVHKEFNSPEKIKQVTIHMLREKVVIHMLEKVTVTDVDADEWARSQNDKK